MLPQTWPRFSGYQVRAGVIRPTSRAALIRDVQGAGLREAYLSLVRLAGMPGFDSSANGAPAAKADAERALLTWCDTHGLLGVLLHRVQLLAVPMRPPKRGLGWAPPEFLYVRSPTGWDTTSPLEIWQRDANGYRVEPYTIPGEVHAYGVTGGPKRIAPSLLVARVLLADTRSGAIQQEPIQTTWARFFPGRKLPATVTGLREFHQRYPKPLTDEFWNYYAEPVADFVAAARVLRDALSALGEPDSAAQQSGRELIARLVGPTSIVPQVQRGGLSLGFESPSLLGSLAMAALEDLTRGSRPALCDRCGHFFVASKTSSRYCSRTCRFTAQKRRQRKRKPKRSSRSRETEPGITRRPRPARAPA